MISYVVNHSKNHPKKELRNLVVLVLYYSLESMKKHDRKLERKERKIIMNI